jgi:S-(hydroxymethyl)mycothiol dehydrogenase
MDAIRASAVIVRSAGAPAAVEEIIIDPPGPGEVLIQIAASGICHTDLHAKLGAFGREFPYLLGHEATGVVVTQGPGVTRPSVGETVVVTWRAPCGSCRFCTTGRPVRCERPQVAAPRMRTTDGQTLGRVLGVGSFATHTVVAAAQAVPIPAELAAHATCLIGCCVATGVGAVLWCARPQPGAVVAVFGCGAVGASVIMGARLAQARRIIAVDLAAGRLEAARGFGATDVVVGGPDAVKAVRGLSGGGVELAFEAVGLPETLAQALGAVEVGGTAVLIGVPVPGATLSYPMVKLFHGRQQLLTTWGGDALPARDFPLLAEWYRRGALDLDGLVSKRVGLGDVEAAFADMQRGEGLRQVIVPEATG